MCTPPALAYSQHGDNSAAQTANMHHHQDDMIHHTGVSQSTAHMPAPQQHCCCSPAPAVLCSNSPHLCIFTRSKWHTTEDLISQNTMITV